ncbi:MAG: hypothetical protein BGN96_14965 [Bacteroidales bacterium 45-6]|nr:MAG: hypothetical protein BGN96_14965 [Bacteroidales bacterium 45-6]
MANDNPALNYDEDDAVRFIQKHLPQEMKGKFTDDEINYVIDIVYDFYDEKGFMNEETDEDSTVEIDEEELIQYVLKSIKKDKIKPFIEEEVTSIIQGELDYSDSLDIFE